MAFSTNFERRSTPSPRQSSAMSGQAFFTTLAILIAAFCLWDYSSYGSGVVAQGLHRMQHDFQGFVYSFRLRM